MAPSLVQLTVWREGERGGQRGREGGKDDDGGGGGQEREQTSHVTFVER